MRPLSFRFSCFWGLLDAVQNQFGEITFSDLLPGDKPEKVGYI